MSSALNKPGMDLLFLTANSKKILVKNTKEMELRHTGFEIFSIQ
jgi:hypothetical protein